jgi:hypothetical protein
MKIFLPIVFLVLLMSACEIEAQVYNDETRSLNSFSKLKVQNGIDVYLTHSNEESAKIEARGHQLKDIKTEVVGDELRISHSSRLLRSGNIKVYLNYRNLTAIEASGGSDVKSENVIKADEFYARASGGSDLRLSIETYYMEAHVSGGSDLYLNGSTEAFSFTAGGGSDIKAENFQSKRGVVKVSGGSDANLNVTGELEVSASGGSDVNVTGNPAIRKLNNDISSDIRIKN